VALVLPLAFALLLHWSAHHHCAHAPAAAKRAAVALQQVSTSPAAVGDHVQAPEAVGPSAPRVPLSRRALPFGPAGDDDEAADPSGAAAAPAETLGVRIERACADARPDRAALQVFRC
jgi:hypothetical protein